MPPRLRKSGDYYDVDDNIRFVKGFFFKPHVFKVDGILQKYMTYVELNGASTGVDLTIDAPERGRLLIITCTDASYNCTAVLTAGDFDGSSGATATFDAAEETLILLGVSSTRYVIWENIGGVSFS